MKTIIFFFLSCLQFLNCFLFAQVCPDCQCGTTPFSTEQSNPATLLGGIYKPARSDVGGAPFDEHKFPVIIVFVSFKDEPGDSISTDPDSWPAGKAPNYINSIIDSNRIVNSSWWNSYNGYSLSDYWHEYSRGKLHVTGKAFHVKLDSIFSNNTLLVVGPRSTRENQEGRKS